MVTKLLQLSSITKIYQVSLLQILSFDTMIQLINKKLETQITIIKQLWNSNTKWHRVILIVERVEATWVL